MSNNLAISIKRTGSPVFSNNDIITGEVTLTVTRSIDINYIEVKLEGVSRSELRVMRQRNRSRNNTGKDSKTIWDAHKLLYQTVVVFPPSNVREVSNAKDFTLTPGTYTYPFEFRLPMYTQCESQTPDGRQSLQNGNLNLNMINSQYFLGISNKASSMFRLETGNSHFHLVTPLPPTIKPISNFASIDYFVKATCKRSSFFKTSLREHDPFEFTPLDPILPISDRKIFVRKKILFKDRVPDVVGISLPPGALASKKLPTTPKRVKKGFFQKLFDNYVDLPAPPPSLKLGLRMYYPEIESNDVEFGFEIRFPDPPSMILDQPVSFSLFLVSNTDPSVYSFAKYGKPEDSNGMGVVYMQRLEAEIISTTVVSVLEQSRDVIHHGSKLYKTLLCDNSFDNIRLDLKDCTPLNNSMVGMPGFRFELEIPPKYYSNCVLPVNLSPSFEACNISRGYTLELKAGFTSEQLEYSSSRWHNWRLTYNAEVVCPNIRILSGRNSSGPGYGSPSQPTYRNSSQPTYEGSSQPTYEGSSHQTNENSHRNSHSTNNDVKRRVEEIPVLPQRPMETPAHNVPNYENPGEDTSVLPTYDDAIRN